MRKWLLFVLMVVVPLAIPFSTGHTEGVSLGVKAGTLGVGPEVGVSFNKYIGARLGFNYLHFSYSGEKSDIDYGFDLKLQNVGGVVDVHPFKNAFRISGGVFYNGNKLDASGRSSSGTFKIGGHKYPAALVGNLDGDIDFNDFSPYCGVGVDTTFGKEKNFGFTMELGVLFQGTPDVSLSADGPISGSNRFKRDLAKEEEDLKDDLNGFKYYPVISVGMSYRF